MSASSTAVSNQKLKEQLSLKEERLVVIKESIEQDKKVQEKALKFQRDLARSTDPTLSRKVYDPTGLQSEILSFYDTSNGISTRVCAMAMTAKKRS